MEQDRRKASRPGRWALTLFGLPFAGAGIGMLLLLLAPVLVEWQQSRTWVPVEARLLAAELVVNHGDSTTYQATARYQYRYAGRDWTGDRVSLYRGADNLGGFQEQLGNELEQAFRTGRPVTVYVNPDDPAQALVDRTLRVGYLSFMAAFVLLFGGIGVGMMVWAWRAPAAAAAGVATAQPWLANPAWATPAVKSGSHSHLAVAWVFAVVWCLLVAPANFVIPEELAQGNHAILAILLFDAVGLGLLAWAIHATLARRRFGEVVLHLDPYPGSIGGDVGGQVDLRLPHDAGMPIEATLACQRVHQVRSGKNTRTQRSAHWTDTRHFLTEPTADGNTRLYLRFTPPAGLPVAEAQSDDYTEWSLELRAAIPGVDLFQRFVLPVYDVPGSMRAATRVRETQVVQLARLESLLNLEQVPGGIALRQRPGRSLAGSLMLGIAGAVFAGVPAFLLYNEADILTLLLFGVVFGLVGLLLVLLGLWTLLNGLEVRVDDSGAEVRRFLAGIPVYRRALARPQLAGIGWRHAGSSQVGSRTTEHYELVLRLQDGGDLVIADGLNGGGEARLAADTLTGYTRLPVLGELARTSLAARAGARRRAQPPR